MDGPPSTAKNDDDNTNLATVIDARLRGVAESLEVFLRQDRGAMPNDIAAATASRLMPDRTWCPE